MPDLKAQVLTRSPLHLGHRKPYGRFLETATAIPGTILRAAVAEGLLAEAASDGLGADHESCSEPSVCVYCYYTEGVVFPFCHVGESGAPTEVPPRTLMSCKQAPGFARPSVREGASHGVRDSLLERIAYAELSRLDPGIPLPRQVCSECEATLEPFGQRYLWAGPSQARCAPGVETRRMVRVALNRARGTAEDGLLYSVQAIAEGTSFVGTLHVPEDWDPKRIEQFADRLRAVRYLGGGTSRGLGQVEIQVWDEWSARKSPSERVDSFNDALGRVWGNLAQSGAGLPTRPSEQYLAVLMLTPGIFATPDGMPTLRVGPELLAGEAERLGFASLPPLESVPCSISPDDERPLMFTAAQTVGGWSAAWHLPKPTALAAVAGSVYVFRCPDLAPWAAALEALERTGIGGRRLEGFGAIRFCDPIHVVGSEEEPL